MQNTTVQKHRGYGREPIRMHGRGWQLNAVGKVVRHERIRVDELIDARRADFAPKNIHVYRNDKPRADGKDTGTAFVADRDHGLELQL